MGEARFVVDDFMISHEKKDMNGKWVQNAIIVPSVQDVLYLGVTKTRTCFWAPLMLMTCLMLRRVLSQACVGQRLLSFS